MITVTALQLVSPGRESEVEALMRDLTANVKANEPGCATFDYARSGEDIQSYLVIEKYQDNVALEHHMKTSYLREFIPRMMACLVHPPEVKTYSDILAAPSLPPSFFHVGIVVANLEEGMARYSDALGIQFAEPATFHVPRIEDPEAHSIDLVAAFSMTQPPYYELIQADGTGIISEANCGRILYFACWEADMASRLKHLETQGIGLDALFRMDATSPPFSMITAPDLSGSRVEYVDVRSRGAIEEWVRTGRYPGGVGG